MEAAESELGVPTSLEVVDWVHGEMAVVRRECLDKLDGLAAAILESMHEVVVEVVAVCGAMVACHDEIKATIAELHSMTGRLGHMVNGTDD